MKGLSFRFVLFKRFVLLFIYFNFKGVIYGEIR